MTQAIAGRYRQRIDADYVVTDHDIRRILAQPCLYCGAAAVQVDHAHALGRGGRHAVGNLVPACARCNMAKQTKTITEFRHAMGVLGRLGVLIDWSSDTRAAWRETPQDFLLNPGQCPGCGGELIQPRRGRRRLYCSDRCRRDAYVERYGVPDWQQRALAAGWTPPTE